MYKVPTNQYDLYGRYVLSQEDSRLQFTKDRVQNQVPAYWNDARQL